jgi:hypothetical protein
LSGKSPSFWPTGSSAALWKKIAPPDRREDETFATLVAESIMTVMVE